jgi:hypothetical protein
VHCCGVRFLKKVDFSESPGTVVVEIDAPWGCNKHNKKHPAGFLPPFYLPIFDQNFAPNQSADRWDKTPWSDELWTDVGRNVASLRKVDNVVVLLWCPSDSLHRITTLIMDGAHEVLTHYLQGRTDLPSLLQYAGMDTGVRQQSIGSSQCV